MHDTIYRSEFAEHDTDIELHFKPNAWTRFHLSVGGYHKMSYDSLITATHDVVRVVAGLGADPQEALDSIIAHFDDPKIYAGETEGNQMPWLVNEYEWDDEEED